jgi:hypothetical protein
LDSGLIQVGLALLRRMYASRGAGPIEPLLDYLTGGADWTLPVLQQESPEGQATAAGAWSSNLALLDISILSIIGDGAEGDDPNAATQVLSDALVDSLWERQLRRQDSRVAAAVRLLVTGRVQHLWRTSTPSQRRGWYLAGLGADAGSRLSAISEHIIELMYEVEVDMSNDDQSAACDRLVEIAHALFGLETFAPEVEIDDWSNVLRHWVQGLSLGDLPGDRVAIAQFIESDLVYRPGLGHGGRPGFRGSAGQRRRRLDDRRRSNRDRDRNFQLVRVRANPLGVRSSTCRCEGGREYWRRVRVGSGDAAMDR